MIINTTEIPEDDAVVTTLTLEGRKLELTRYTLAATTTDDEVHVEEYVGPAGGKLIVERRGNTAKMWVYDIPGDKGRRIAQKNFATELRRL